jgi:hypothetical protein
LQNYLDGLPVVSWWGGRVIKGGVKGMLKKYVKEIVKDRIKDIPNKELQKKPIMDINDI